MDPTEALLNSALTQPQAQNAPPPTVDPTTALLLQHAQANDWHQPPPAAPQKPPAKTSFPGVLGAAERGAGPYAAGALAGGAIGAMGGGVGAIPGAAIGAGLVGLGDLGYGLYDLAAPHMGLPHVAGPSEAWNNLLDHTSIPRPQTPTERIVQSGSQGLGAALSGTAASRTLGNVLTNPTASNMFTSMGQTTAPMAASSGALSGTAGQGVKEAGGGPWAQAGASLLAGAVPYIPRMLGSMARQPLSPAANDSMNAGYAIPPNSAAPLGESPSKLSQALSAMAGKIKINQMASVKNQGVTNDIVASDLGLPEGTELNKSVIGQVRDAANQAYERVATAAPHIDPNNDSQYLTDVTSLGGRSSAAAAAFPKSWSNAGIDDLQDDLLNPNGFSAQAALDQVRHLRAQAVSNFSSNNPQDGALGVAQRQGADALDDLIERHLQSNPATSGLVDQYKSARQLLAKTYDAEAALNPATGNVSAARLGALLRKGRPISGGMEDVARASLAFPKATQNPDAFGNNENFSVLDAGAAAGAFATGHPGIAAGIIARPFIRGTVLATPYQGAMRGMSPPLPATVAGTALNQEMTSPNQNSKRLGAFLKTGNN